ncbi:hypothetical protein [Pseudomonas sp. H2_C01]
MQQQHALVVEPDTAIVGGEKQTRGEFCRRRRTAVGQLVAVTPWTEVLGGDPVIRQLAVGIIHCYAPDGG